MNKKLLCAGILLSSLVTLGYSAQVNLYSSQSTSASVVDKIDLNNPSNWQQFYTTKDGNWSEYINSDNGKVGWVDLQQVNQAKADNLRQQLLKGIDDNIAYYQKQIVELNKDKKTIAVASYKDLQQYAWQNSGFGNVHVFYF